MYLIPFSRVVHVIENSFVIDLTHLCTALTSCYLLLLMAFSVPCIIIVHLLLQEREMGGGVFYDTLCRETFTQELHMLTK